MCTRFFSMYRGFTRFLVLFLFLLLTSTSEGAVRYVHAGAGGANDGTSWTDAFTELRAALTAAVGGDELWVAAGIYRPTSGIDRSISFVLKNGVALYGGFAGTEASLNQRNWDANETVLSGNIGAPATSADNSYRVVVASGTNGTAILDGFTIADGNADGPAFEQKRGGGMYNDGGSPTVKNCHFISNSAEKDGGGMFIHKGNPVMTLCTFSQNSAGEHGGGMFIWWDSSPILTNCIVSSNVAVWGAGACNYNSGTPKFIESIFQNNHASAYGGGMFNEGGSPEVTNSFFSRNIADIEGGGMFNAGGGALKTIRGCTFSQNSAGKNGGGMSNQHVFSVLAVIDSTFFGNTAQTGGGMYNWSSSSPVVTNCTFSANKATTGGGMLSTNWSNPVMMNCTFAENRADLGGDALYNTVGSAPVATNSIFWGHGASIGQIKNENVTLTITYSVTDQPGTGNIAGDPKLGPLADNGGPSRTHALFDGSSALNTGTATGAPATDQRGIARPQGVGVDIGAYERGGTSPLPVPSGSGGGCNLGCTPSLFLLLLPLVVLVRR